MTKNEIKLKAEQSLSFFAQLVNPGYAYGDIHFEVFQWWTTPERMLDTLVLLPRGTLKSHMAAVWCAWWITKNPDTTILYVSGTEDLALQQLYSIKTMLTSDVYTRYWPEMVDPQDAKREEWSARNIKVDHPLRKERGVRDRTVAARSVGGNTTGLHCDVLVFDDLVVPSNAYTEIGRADVAAAYSQFSSVLNPGGISLTVGTRYHGKDIYGQMLETEVEEFDNEGNVVGSHKMYEVLERRVEDEGVFLWPRIKAKSGKWFGFDQKTLAQIRAKYFASNERAQYYAQYFNNPNEGSEERIGADGFTYYDPRHLKEIEGEWWFKNKRLSVYAAGDLAYTEGARSDFTAYAVIGLDSDGFIYILELVQFKTTKYSKMYDEAIRLHKKWRFKKLRMETNAGANLVVEYMKDQVRRDGESLNIEGKRSVGEKQERSAAILLPRYEGGSILHYRGGYTTIYEEQVMLPRPAHDDLRDAVSAAVEISSPPSSRSRSDDSNVISFHARFGGRIR